MSKTSWALVVLLVVASVVFYWRSTATTNEFHLTVEAISSVEVTTEKDVPLLVAPERLAALYDALRLNEWTASTDDGHERVMNDRYLTIRIEARERYIAIELTPSRAVWREAGQETTYRTPKSVYYALRKYSVQ